MNKFLIILYSAFFFGNFANAQSKNDTLEICLIDSTVFVTIKNNVLKDSSDKHGYEYRYCKGKLICKSLWLNGSQRDVYWFYPNGTLKKQFLAYKDSIGELYSFNTFYYSNGAIKSQGKMRDGKTGFWEFFHENGLIASSGNFKNNLKQGYWEYWSEDGCPIKIETFDAGNSIKLNEWKCVYKNGKKIQMEK